MDIAEDETLPRRYLMMGSALQFAGHCTYGDSLQLRSMSAEEGKGYKLTDMRRGQTGASASLAVATVAADANVV
jgi:hypothetical protein